MISVLNVLDRDINLNVKAQIHYMLWKSAWDEKETHHLNNKWESSLDLSPRVAGGDVWCPGGDTRYGWLSLNWGSQRKLMKS